MTWNTSSNEAIAMDLNIAYWEQIATAVAIVITAIAGLIGNTMIILAVAFSRKLHTPTNAFVTSLTGGNWQK